MAIHSNANNRHFPYGPVRTQHGLTVGCLRGYLAAPDGNARHEGGDSQDGEFLYSLLNSHIGQKNRRRMLNMKLLQKARTYFHNPELPPVIQRQATTHDEQAVSSRSKRAQIRDVLRQYERSSLKEAEAIEELLRILR